MDRRPYWQASSGDPQRSRRIERMTVALTRLRQIDDAYVIFEARSRPDRYIQFANRRGGSAADHAEISVAAPLPVLASAVPVGTSGRAPTLVPSDQEPRWISVGPFYGEPDHEPLLMEVSSGLWPGSDPRSLAHDETVVAGFDAIGLRLGGGPHTCLNFCRGSLTEPSEILALLCEDILVEILRAEPTYELVVTQGRFSRTNQRAVPNLPGAI